MTALIPATAVLLPYLRLPINDLRLCSLELQGTVDATYAEIVALFGQPNEPQDVYGVVTWRLVLTRAQPVAIRSSAWPPGVRATQWEIHGTQPTAVTCVRAMLDILRLAKRPLPNIATN